jgi:hypothetical protein
LYTVAVWGGKNRGGERTGRRTGAAADAVVLIFLRYPDMRDAGFTKRPV